MADASTRLAASLLSLPVAALTAAGRHGPALLCGGVLVGLAAPGLAAFASPSLGVAAFILTLGTLLKVDLPSFRAEVTRRGRTALVLTWCALGVPLLAAALLGLARPGPDLALALVLCTAAPPAGSAPAIAAMLRLNAPLALLATTALTLAAPFYLPPLATALAGADVSLNPVALSLRLGAIVGGAALAACLVRRRAGRWVAANPHVPTGVAVAGLLLMAVGMMHGMHGLIAAAPERAATMLGAAFLLNVALQLTGALLFLPFGVRRALTVGLVSGNRSIALVWATVAPMMAAHPQVQLFAAVSLFPIFMLPAVMQAALLPLLGRRSAALRAAGRD